MGKSLENICKGEKRRAALLAAVSLTGSISDPFIIWNGVETHSGAHVRLLLAPYRIKLPITTLLLGYYLRLSIAFCTTITFQCVIKRSL